MITQDEASLLARLASFKDRFLEIRDRFGIDDRIGFASLPKAHGAYSLGMMIEGRTTNDGLLVYQNCQGMFAETELLPLEEMSRALILPSKSPGSYVVSVYQRKGWWDLEPIEERVLDVSDLVLEGVVAHELSHWVKEFGVLPEPISEALLKKSARVDQRIINAYRGNAEDKGWLDHVWAPCNDEDTIDVIAGLFGFKDAVVAKLDYMAGCIQEYAGPDYDGPRVTPKEALKQMRYRKSQVLEVCG